MKILVVDDGQLAINSLIRILCRVAPDCDYISAMTTEDALSWMRQGPMDAAFLNLEMPGMNGLALTRMIQKLQPRCNIIVVTEHPEYALEALQIFVSGFLLKPANEADVRNVLEHLRYPLPAGQPLGHQFLSRRVYDPVFLGRGDPFSAAPAGKCAENSLDPQLLCAAYRLLNQKKQEHLRKSLDFLRCFFLT